MRFRSLAAMLSLATCSTLALAQDIEVTRATARATVPQQKSAGAYLTLENRGQAGDRLVAASTPVARRVELHTMSMDGNVMRMREVDAIALKPSSKVEMRPGEGYHLMLIGLNQSLQAGQSFPLTLQFEKAGKVEVKVAVEGRATGHGKH